MKLIEEWRSALKMFSMQAMGAAFAVQGAWAALSDDLKSSIPHGMVTGLTLTLLAAGIGGRLVRQTKKEAKR
jgi:hypothetical protein